MPKVLLTARAAAEVQARQEVAEPPDMWALQTRELPSLDREVAELVAPQEDLRDLARLQDSTDFKAVLGKEAWEDPMESEDTPHAHYHWAEHRAAD